MPSVKNNDKKEIFLSKIDLALAVKKISTMSTHYCTHCLLPGTIGTVPSQACNHASGHNFVPNNAPQGIVHLPVKSSSGSSSYMRQKSMRTHLKERNRKFWYKNNPNDKSGHYRCDICGRETNKAHDFLNAHIVPHAHARRLSEATKFAGDKLPVSPSYVSNGLFLCGDCDAHYEDHFLTIDGDGTIRTFGDPKPEKRYRKLQGQKVQWARLIGNSTAWPTAETLDFHNTLVPVCGEHRKHLFGVDSDDHSTATENEPESGSELDFTSLLTKRKAEESEESDSRMMASKGSDAKKGSAAKKGKAATSQQKKKDSVKLYQVKKRRSTKSREDQVSETMY